MALRTWWFDEQLLESLEGGGQGAAPRQVVVLGAGMDTRPWRLRLPPGWCWASPLPANSVEVRPCTSLTLAVADTPDAVGSVLRRQCHVGV